MTFRIITVCTGNICRSPLAELVLARAFADVPEVEVSSAGTMAMVGDGMPAQSQAIAARYGLDPTHHAARQLDAALLNESDLVLGMSLEHRKAVAIEAPRASKRAFSLREFAWLASHGVDEAMVDEFAADLPDTVEGRLAAVVAAVAGRRGIVDAPLNPDAYDIVDPYRRSTATYERSAAELLPAAGATAHALLQGIGRQWEWQA